MITLLELTYNFPMRNDRIRRAIRRCIVCDPIYMHILKHLFDSKYPNWCRWLSHGIPSVHKHGLRASIQIPRTCVLHSVWIDLKWNQNFQMPPSMGCNRFRFVNNEQYAMPFRNWDMNHRQSSMRRQLSYFRIKMKMKFNINRTVQLLPLWRILTWARFRTWMDLCDLCRMLAMADQVLSS